MILDATERPVQRSKDRGKQRDDYSGKKKRHTRSPLALVNPDQKILLFSQAHAGRHHDVYASIAFYLNHQEEVESYLKQRQQKTQSIRHMNEARFDPQGLRDRLLARTVDQQR